MTKSSVSRFLHHHHQYHHLQRALKICLVWRESSKSEREIVKRKMSRSLVKRFVPYVSARIRENHRMLNYYCSSASSALKEASSSSSQSESPSLEAVHLSENCIRVCHLLQFNKFTTKLPMEMGRKKKKEYLFRP